MAIHITPHKKGWQVKNKNALKAYRVVDTQQEAIVIGRTEAINQDTNIKVHNRHGKIRVGYNYKGVKKD